MWGRLDLIAELSEVPDHLRDASLRTLASDLGAAFVVVDALVEYLPDEATEPMGHGPDRLCVPEADHQTAIQELEDATFGLHRRVRSLRAVVLITAMTRE